MAQKSGFFTSSSGDRKYGSDWLAKYIAAIISNGVYTTELTVSGDNGNMSVAVGAGRAWINGYMYSNDSNMTLALSAADGALSRTDLIVLRLDMTNRQITLAVVQGDFGGGVPALTRTSDIYELCLAQIAVAAGTTQITAQMITDTRADETVCGIVAGAVTQLSTGELLEQLKAGFEEWFDGIKGQLSEDAAGNLQNQINDCVKTADKATEEEAIAGTDDTKYVTPAKAKLSLSKFRLLASYTEAGAVEFTVPENIHKILVFKIAGGGSGGAATKLSPSSGYYCVATGGSSGEADFAYMDVTPNDVIAGVVGAGGAAASVSAGTGNNNNGNTGGTTSFNGISVAGGMSGLAQSSVDGSSIPNGAFREGAQASSRGFTPLYTPYGYIKVYYSSSSYSNTEYVPRPMLLNLLMSIKEQPFHIAAGGKASLYFLDPNYTATVQTKVDFSDTLYSSEGASTVLNETISATKGTDPGCGGGGCVSKGGAATSAAGADGGIFIYEVLE